MKITKDILKQMIAEEMANEKGLKAKIRKAHKEEGGAAGMDALEKHTKASAKDIKAAVKDMDDVGQHKDGDYIQGDGKKIQIAKEQMSGEQKDPEMNSKKPFAEGYEYVPIEDMTCEEVRAEYASYRKQAVEAEREYYRTNDHYKGMEMTQLQIDAKEMKKKRAECWEAERQQQQKDQEERDSGDFSQLYKESKKGMLKRIVAEELAKIEIEALMKEHPNSEKE